MSEFFVSLSSIRGCTPVCQRGHLLPLRGGRALRPIRHRRQIHHGPVLLGSLPPGEGGGPRLRRDRSAFEQSVAAFEVKQTQ